VRHRVCTHLGQAATGAPRGRRSAGRRILATDFVFQALAGHPALYLKRGSNHQFLGGIPKSHDRAVAADRSAAIALGVKQPLDERLI